MAAPAHATIADVAAAAQVSASTASRALREHPAVSPRTRRRVKAAAKRLGYEPNRMAAALRSRTSSFVGIVVPDITFPFFAFAVKGAQDVLEQAGYHVLAMNTDRRAAREREALRTLLAHRAGGVLLATSGGFDFGDRLPLVFFANFEPGSGHARVALSNREGIGLLVDHLAAHGHQRIAYVGGRPDVTSGGERLDGFREAVERAGLAGGAAVRISDDSWSPASAAAATAELLRGPGRLSAIVAGGDRLALGAIRAIKAAGMRIPDDIALVSFQDPDPLGVLEPAVTSLAGQERELGRHAAGLLLAALAAPAETPSALEVRLPATLVVRRSCGCDGPLQSLP